MFNLNNIDPRAAFHEIWQKYQQGQTLQPLEQQIISIIQKHPEYLNYIENPSNYVDCDFANSGEGINPYLHLSMHLGLLEQLTTNRPQGIVAIYKQLVTKLVDSHHADHAMMSVLSDEMWQALNQTQDFNDERYLQKLRQLLHE